MASARRLDYASYRRYGHGPPRQRPVVRPPNLSGERRAKVQVRKKKVYTPPTDIRPAATAATRKPSPVWLPVTAVALIVFGIAWLVVYYLSETAVPGGGLGVLEPRGGLRRMVASLGMLSRWR